MNHENEQIAQQLNFETTVAPKMSQPVEGVNLWNWWNKQLNLKTSVSPWSGTEEDLFKYWKNFWK